MYTNSDVVDMFYDGETSGISNNMEIVDISDSGTIVLGYQHAVYAYRPPNDEFKPVVFTGWSDASKTTGSHISMLTDGDCIEAEGRAKEPDIYDEPSLDYLMQIADNDKDYSKPHRRNERGGDY